MRSRELPLAKTGNLTTSPLREDEEYLATSLKIDSSIFIVVSWHQAALKSGEDKVSELVRFNYRELISKGVTPNFSPAEGSTSYFLGEKSGINYFALAIDPTVSGEGGSLEGMAESDSLGVPGLLTELSFLPLREIAAGLSDLEAGLATTAVALQAWHASARFCPSCGAPVQVRQGGWIRRCLLEGKDVYPRTDPAVIVLLTDQDDRILLAQASHWRERRYSNLAGFVEAGESAETAVHREVKEEVGLELTAVEYWGSQPWPFPRSLMLAYSAKAKPGPLTLAVDEIADAKWFSRKELLTAIQSAQVQLPGQSSIARAMIEDWYGERLPSEWNEGS